MQIIYTMPCRNVPDSSTLVAGTGNKELSILREVERVNFLIMSYQEMLDASFRDVPDLGSKEVSEWCRSAL